MYIKNKLIRVVVSVCIPILTYVGLSTFLADAWNDDILEIMFVFAIYGFLIVVPFLIFMPIVLYRLFTKNEERSKEGGIISKVLMILLIIVVLIFVDAMTIDLLDAIW